MTKNNLQKEKKRFFCLLLNITSYRVLLRHIRFFRPRIFALKFNKRKER
jgi:hypothetical protein